MEIQSDSRLYGRKTKKAFVQYPSTCGFVVKNSLKNCSRKGAASLRDRHCFHLVNLGTGRSLTYRGARIQSRFYPGDCVTRTGDREIRSVSGRLPDYPGELA